MRCWTASPACRPRSSPSSATASASPCRARPPPWPSASTGADLDTLDKVAHEIAGVLEGVPGAADVAVQTPPETPVVRVDLDPARLAQRGVSATEVLDTVQTAYQGGVAAQVYEQNRTLDIAVTLPAYERQDPEAVGDLLIRSASGVSTPLRSVANVHLDQTRTSISHEGGRARQVVTANPKPADVKRVTEAAKAAIAQKVKLPAGVYLDYAGTAEATAGAQRELGFNVALAALGVVALLLIAFGDGRAVTLILGARPSPCLAGWRPWP